MHCDVEDTESSTNKQHHLSFIHPPIARSCGPSRMALRGYMAVGSFLFLKEQLKGIIILGLRVGFINISDMYNNDVGKGTKGRAQGCEAYEVKKRVALVRVPFYLINLLPTSICTYLYYSADVGGRGGFRLEAALAKSA